MDRDPIEIYSSSETENGYLLQLSLDLSAFAGKFPNFSSYRRYPILIVTNMFEVRRKRTSIRSFTTMRLYT